jgi:nitrate reductase gamma subunit
MGDPDGAGTPAPPATARGAGAPVPGPYDYRLGVAVWFRSLFALDPGVTAMAHAPLVYQCHALPALALFALWPFGRLVHAFSVPLGYPTRPCVVYRSRGGAAPARRGARGVGVR